MEVVLDEHAVEAIELHELLKITNDLRCWDSTHTAQEHIQAILHRLWRQLLHACFILHVGIDLAEQLTARHYCLILYINQLLLSVSREMRNIRKKHIYDIAGRLHQQRQLLVGNVRILNAIVAVEGELEQEFQERMDLQRVAAKTVLLDEIKTHVTRQFKEPVLLQTHEEASELHLFRES